MTEDTRANAIGQVILWEQENYRIVALGIETDGKIYAHLASMARGRHGKNGFHPAQIAAFLPCELIANWADSRVF